MGDSNPGQSYSKAYVPDYFPLFLKVIIEGFQRNYKEFSFFFNLQGPIVLVSLFLLPKSRKYELFRRADPSSTFAWNAVDKV